MREPGPVGNNGYNGQVGKGETHKERFAIARLEWRPVLTLCIYQELVILY